MDNIYSINFTGDLSFSGNLDKACRRNDLLSYDVKTFLATSDETVVSFEGSITPCRITNRKRILHRSENQAFDFIEKHFKKPLLSFASGSFMDYGYVGMVDSLEGALEKGIPYIGAGFDIDEASSFYYTGNDNVRLGIIAMTSERSISANDIHGGPFCEYSDSLLKHQIEKARKNCDWLVLVFNGGEEYLSTPMPYMRKQMKKYLSWGIDVIVCNHPHVVQPYEKVGNKTIFYSLGTFLNDDDYHRLQPGTDEGIILRLDFKKDSYTFESFPVIYSRELSVLSGRSDNAFFTDIRNLPYSRLWKKEAARKPDVEKAIAAMTEKKELDAIHTAEKESIRIEQLKRAHLMKLIRKELAEESALDALSSDSSEEEPAVVKKPSFARRMKNLYRNVFTNARINRRAFQISWGRFLCRLFHM